jgi:hypothetical protein
MRRIWFLPGLTFCVFFLAAGLATAFAGAPYYADLRDCPFAFGLLGWWATPADTRHPSTTDCYPAVSVEPCALTM